MFPPPRPQPKYPSVGHTRSGRPDQTRSVWLLQSVDVTWQTHPPSAQRGKRVQLAKADDIWTLSRDAVKEPVLLVRHLIGCAGHKDGGMFRRDSLGSIGACGFAGSSPTGNETRHHGAFTGITLLTDLLIQTARIVATLIPALLEVVAKLIHFRRATMRRLPLGELSAP